MDATGQPAGKRVYVTIELDPEDAKRFEQAFAEGKLDEIGVLRIRRVDDTEKHWTGAEAARHKPKDPKDRRPRRSR